MRGRRRRLFATITLLTAAAPVAVAATSSTPAGSTVSASTVALTAARSPRPESAGRRAQGVAERLALGIELLEAGRLEAAIAALEEVVELVPDHPRARYELGRALHAAGRFEEALRHLRTALPTANDPAAFRLLVGRALIDLGRLAEARGELEAAAASRPDFAPIRYQLARLCYRAGNVDAALDRLDAVVRIAPRWIEPLLLAADIAAESGDNAAAAGRIRSALDVDPAQPLLWLRLADLLVAEGDRDGARQAHERAIAVDPDASAARLAMAFFLFNDQRFEEAAAALTDFLVREPDDPQALLPLAETMMIAGRHDAALQTLESVLGGATEATLPFGDRQGRALPAAIWIGAQELRAQTLVSLDRLDEAAGAARAVLAVDPGNLDALFALGTALARSGDERGREHLRTFQRLSDLREHRELAADYFHLGGDIARAEEQYRRALAIEPNDAGSLAGLGSVLLARGDVDGALAALAAAREAGADDRDWHRDWVLALHGAGRTEEATRAWQRARERGIRLGPRVWAAVRAHEGVC